MNCSISSNCSTRTALSEVVTELSRAGFRRIQLTGNISYSPDNADCVREWVRSAGLEFLIHNYFPIAENEPFVLDPAASDQSLRERTILHVRRNLNLLSEVGQRQYSLHPGFINELKPVMKDHFFVRARETQNSRRDFFRTIGLLAKAAEDMGMRLAVENLHPKSRGEIYSFLCTPDDILSFLQWASDHKAAGILLDLGHLNVASSVLGFDKMKLLDKICAEHMEKIYEFHISANDGLVDRHMMNPPGCRQLDFLSEMKNQLKDVEVVCEWLSPPLSQAFARYKEIEEALSG